MKKTNPTINFVALDGEAIENRYCLLGSNLENEIRVDPSNWIGTADAIEFLWSLRWKLRGYTFVWFAGHYDVNQIMRDMSNAGKEALFSGVSVVFKGYKITYLQRKFLRIKKLESKESSLTIYDVWSFFGSSFLAACEKFLVNDPDWKKYKDKIAWGKQARVAFDSFQFEMMKQYNKAECELLVKLMDKIAAMLERNNIKLTRWYGPSAIAGTLLRENDISLEYPAELEWFEEKPELQDAFYRAYFGGRIEALQLGTFKNIFYYDINSAYPTALSQVSRTAENWKHTKKYINVSCSVWHIKWSLPKNCPIGIFPYRDKTGAIYFPRCGEGWYWQPEIDFALKYFAGSIKLVEGYYQKFRVSKMTELVLSLYAKRQELKAAGDEAEYVLKIALNSMYGKFAQRLGLAPYRNLYWAGYTTSYTRARLLEAVYGYESNIIAFATDGIISTKEIRGLKFSKKLGDWTREEWTKATVLMPGVYLLYRKEKGKEKLKTGIRGYKNLDWDQVIKDLTKKGTSITTQKIFVSHKLAQMQPNAFGKHYLGFVDFNRTIQPRNLDKRHYHFGQIKNWGIDHCDSTIRERIDNGCSAQIKGFAEQSFNDEIYYEEEILR